MEELVASLDSATEAWAVAPIPPMNMAALMASAAKILIFMIRVCPLKDRNITIDAPGARKA